MSNNDLFISPLINRLNELDRNGFKNSGNMRIEGGTRLQNWTRHTQWKKERIQMHYPAQAEWCEFTFWLYLIIEKQEYMLMAEDIGRLKDKHSQYKFPKVLKKFRAKAIIDNVAADVISSLSWFDDKDKQECLRLINSNDENVIIRPHKQIYSKAVELLTP